MIHIIRSVIIYGEKVTKNERSDVASTRENHDPDLGKGQIDIFIIRVICLNELILKGHTLGLIHHLGQGLTPVQGKLARAEQRTY